MLVFIHGTAVFNLESYRGSAVHCFLFGVRLFLPAVCSNPRGSTDVFTREVASLAS